MSIDFLEEAVRMKEEVRFYKDRLRPKMDNETGATEDEIDRLEFENEMLRQDKNRYRDENVELSTAKWRLLETLKGLLADITEYQTINNLGGENNHWQVIARKVINETTEPTDE